MMFVSAGVSADSRANMACRDLGVQARAIWFDAEANLWKLASRQGVADTVAKCKAANINTIIVDVKPLSGLVLYRSKVSPRLATYQGKPYPGDYDLLKTVIEEGHKAGIAVHAAINVFSEGSKIEGGGPALKHPDWQCVEYAMESSVALADDPGTVFTCSARPSFPDEIGASGANPTNFVMPESAVYVRVEADGSVAGRGRASGKAKIAPPEGGCVLVGVEAAGEWLDAAARRHARFEIRSKSTLRRVSEGRATHNAVFVNPLHPQARAHALDVIREICANYDIDGIVLDRMRYPGMFSDFSDITRKAFEKYAGQKIANWPDDVFRLSNIPGIEPIRGPLFKSWLKFRASVMRGFLSEARSVVKAGEKNLKLGIYVGSWYPLYYDVGVNWGSPSNASGYEWWPEGYEETGYADLVDYMCTGCYYAHPTRQEARAKGDEEWKSVEAATEESINAVKDDTFVYGSLYVLQYRGRPGKFVEAVNQCLDKTQGCMLFDLVYLRDYDWWDLLKGAFPGAKRAPHDVPGLLGRVKNGRQSKSDAP